MDIKEANREIKKLLKLNKFNNISCRLDQFNDDIYFRLDRITHLSPNSRESNGVRFDGLMARELIVSFRMVAAKKEASRSFLRKNYIKLYRDRKGRNVLKLIIDREVSKVYFKNLIAV